MRHRGWVVGAVVGGVAAVGWLLGGRGPSDAAGYRTASVDRGDVVTVIGATGTLEAVTTVQVGSQVSGTIAELRADFNSRVRRGQVVARLDPSLFQARLAQARANLVAARANAERARSQVGEASLQLRRAEELAAQSLLPQSDLDSARTAHESAQAQVKAADAAVSQAEASVNQAEVDLDHTVISAPIDGIVIGRNVDVGQTVAASLQAPTLFVIAEDLSRMQVRAAVDEADVGRLRPGQDVEFRVDAYPDELFRGSVTQVRLQPNVEQNVVTYDTIIGVDNPEQKLMPGMTATVTIVVDRRSDVLRIPAVALRFRPQGLAAQSAGPREARRAPGGGAFAGDGPRRHPGGPERVERAEPARGEPGPSEEGAAGTPRGVLVFVLEQGAPVPRRIRTGASDGRFVEVQDGLSEGDPVIVGTELAASASAAASPTPNNPFAPTRQRRER